MRVLSLRLPNLVAVWLLAVVSTTAHGQIARLPSDNIFDHYVQPAAFPAQLPTTSSSSNPIQAGFIDLDSASEPPAWNPPTTMSDWDRGMDTSNWTTYANDWDWQILPSSIIYKAYLAGVKESRFSSLHFNTPGAGWVWDATLGARFGLLRYGNQDPIRPDGFQIDGEGSAQVRLDIPQNVDVRSADFRGGLPITYGMGAHRFKFGYYHLSSHLGDEFLLANPTYTRLNFARDVLIAGYSYYALPTLRFYGETGWAFYSDVSKPWEFQCGIDYSPATPTGVRGAPFFAVNGHIRQELDYSGHFVAQAGWAWLSNENARLFRIGGHYFNGNSNQFSFFRNHEQQLGLGVWYDF